MSLTAQPLESLATDQEILQRIHAHSLDLLEHRGVRFYSARALEIWHGAGAQVDGDVVRIPCHLIESALERAAHAGF